MSIQADDGFNLKMALECELDGVVPYDGLAGSVITRYRRAIRRRVAGAVSVVVALAGIGVPLGLAASGGSGDAAGTGAAGSGPVLLRLASYTLKLPSRYRSSDGTAARCDIGVEESPAETATATSSSGGCLQMTLTPPASPPGTVPRSAEEVTIGRYRAWLVASGYWRGASSGLVIDTPGSDLLIAASGLSPAALVSLVSAGLS
ncbi:MAG: hypothetical protein JO345_38885 [Streptosporangiaceae bacterium]|nr:hypothetical protein [Streptosporangiaceae bacterium]